MSNSRVTLANAVSGTNHRVPSRNSLLMPSSSRAFNIIEFRSHLYEYGFIKRSAGSSSAFSPGPPFAALTQNIISEFLSSLGIDPQSHERLITHGTATSLEESSFDEPHIDHASSRFAALISSKNSEDSSPIQVVQSWPFDTDEWASSSSSDQPLCCQLSVLRFFPPLKAAPTLGLQLRQRRGFYRRWAELPRYFETVEDGLLYIPHLDGSGSGQVTADADGGLVDSSQCDLDFLQDDKGLLIERVRNLPLSSLSSFSSSSSLLSNFGADADCRIVEVRVDLYRAALAYLIDAFRVWNLYRNFTLNYRLAPIKAVVVLKKSEATDETVMSVAKYIEEFLVKKGFPCCIEVIEDDVDEEIENFDDESEEEESEEEESEKKKKKKKSGSKVDVEPSNDFHSNQKLRALMDNNGVGVPFYIALDKTMMDHGILKLYERETRMAEHIHCKMLLPKLVDYLNVYDRVG